MPDIVYRRAIETATNVIFPRQKHALFFCQEIELHGHWVSVYVSFNFSFVSSILRVRLVLCSFHAPHPPSSSFPEAGRDSFPFLCFFSQALVLITTPALNKCHVIENWQVENPFFQFFLPAHEVLKNDNGFSFPGKKLADLCSPRKGSLLSGIYSFKLICTNISLIFEDT